MLILIKIFVENLAIKRHVAAHIFQSGGLIQNIGCTEVGFFAFQNNILDGLNKAVGFKGLADVVVDAELRALLPNTQNHICRHRHNWHIGGNFPDFVRGVIPVHDGHVQIHQNQINFVLKLFIKFDRGLSVGSENRRDTCLF
ncbi:hypothetical protein SDC9_170573 [bioreactor metagenome]|uniref:Uncharacterized protein n=1 Tax=bioreactor metagenome TaxID=1076179 RepID=A0A645G966_9ZZZZ